MGGVVTTLENNLSMGLLAKILSLYISFLILNVTLAFPYDKTCRKDSKLFKVCRKIVQETNHADCSEHLSAPRFSEAYYMDCMRQSFEYSNLCDPCVCTRLQRYDWKMCKGKIQLEDKI